MCVWNSLRLIVIKGCTNSLYAVNLTCLVFFFGCLTSRNFGVKPDKSCVMVRADLFLFKCVLLVVSCSKCAVLHSKTRLRLLSEQDTQQRLCGVFYSLNVRTVLCSFMVNFRHSFRWLFAAPRSLQLTHSGRKTLRISRLISCVYSS